MGLTKISVKVDDETLELLRAYSEANDGGDKVNIKIVNRATISSSLAQLCNRHSRHRTFTTFDYSSLLLSAGRSLSLYDRPVIFSNVQ